MRRRGLPKASIAVAREDGRSGLLEWRCMDCTVYACASGNSPTCGKMGPNDNIVAIRQFCREEPNAIGVPAAVTGRFPVTWRCRQGKPVMQQGDFRVEKQGYPVEQKLVPPQEAALPRPSQEHRATAHAVRPRKPGDRQENAARAGPHLMTPGFWLDPENTAKTSIQTGLLTHQTTIGRGHCQLCAAAAKP